jgi:hypothetical protein
MPRVHSQNITDQPVLGQALGCLLLESGAVRLPRIKATLLLVFATFFVVLLSLSATASAQVVQVTPNISVTPSTTTTAWLRWMALGAIALGVVAVFAIAVSYLRFAPKFYGREDAPRRLPPGVRPPLLTRTTPARSPVGSTRPPVAQTPSGREGRSEPGATATATATAPAPSATTTAPAPPGATQPTSGPSAEPAVQADAVGESEARAPEPRPTAKSAEDAAVEPEDVAAQAPTTAEVSAATENPEAQVPAGRDPAAEASAQSAPEASSEPAAAPSGDEAQAEASTPSRGSSEIDQETFDRVLEEQLGKGVDRRVAEGRARAAAVVAARKKSAST